LPCGRIFHPENQDNSIFGMVNHSLVTLTSSELQADALFLQKTLLLDIEDETASSVTLAGGNVIVILLGEESTEPCCSHQYSSVLVTDSDTRCCFTLCERRRCANIQ